MSTFDCIAAGHICLDMFPQFTNTETIKIPDLLRPGSLVKMGDMTFSTGGSVSNTGIALKIFGLNVGFIAKVGNDAIGKTILEILQKNGNADGIALSNQEGSSYSVVLAPPGIDRIFLHCPGTNDTFTSADIDFTIVDKAKLFHFGYPTLMKSMYSNNGKELKEIFKKVKACGVTTSLDISLPDPLSEAGQANWVSIYKDVLPYVDIFLPSIEEAFFALHPQEYIKRKDAHKGEELIDYISPEEYSSLADEFLGLGCKIIALKSGYNGWYLKSADISKFKDFGKLSPTDMSAWSNKELWCPAFKVEKIASATGSGDTSIAAFLVGLTKQAKLSKCMKFANCAGLMNLKAYDALSGLGSWDDMITQIPSLEIRDIPVLHGTKWKFDNQDQLWTLG